MANFSFLQGQDDYKMFADACLEAERVMSLSPTISALAARRAFELAVKWVYAADETIKPPYKDNLQSLVHEPTFRTSLADNHLWESLQYVIKAGNMAAHRNAQLKPEDAMFSLNILFTFIQWIDYSYGRRYVKRVFDPKQVPAVSHALAAKERKAQEDAARKEYEAQLGKQTQQIAELEARIRALSDQLAARKAEQPVIEHVPADEFSEYQTRTRFIDLDLQLVGWNTARDVIAEYPVTGMEGNPGQQGYVDYLLNGRNGKPLAIIEAKRTAYDPAKGLQQARLYADCLERQFGYRPLIFLSNGYRTYFVDDDNGSYRQVGEVFAQDDLQRILARRRTAIDPSTVPVNLNVAGGNGRAYQLEAIQAVCDNLNQGQRRSLLVMATGTGKTRVSAALADVLMRAGLVKNVLFLADRIELVSQANSAYGEYFPDWSLCNLCSNKHDTDARVVFSTYQTMINAIDVETGADGKPVFSAGHFDLIIVDEAHRSIFKKYKVIFDHFDALMVGLTATPRDDVDRNTYDFFHVQHGVPTFVYEYAQALQDKVLVPFVNVEAKTKFMDEGITYDDLSDTDKERYEEDFGDGDTDDDGPGDDVGDMANLPAHIDAAAINTYVMNPATVDAVLEDLHDHGITTDGGERLGKTIIFAANQAHARYIVERYTALYPKESAGGFIKTVLHGDDYAHSVIAEFKRKPLPVITVSVDMMDTGVDVPDVVNLVFFKKVRSKIKFRQMIGRGTRLSSELDCVDNIDGEYVGKRRFKIFDYCGNFAFFREQTNPVEDKPAASVSERIFARKAELVQAFQTSDFTDDPQIIQWRAELISDLTGQIGAWDTNKVAVRLKREYVERYRMSDAYTFLNDLNVRELTHELAPLAHYGATDVYALRFDALMYGMMVARATGDPAKAYTTKLRAIAAQLGERMTIPQVQRQRELVTTITDHDDYLDGLSVTALERIRIQLRDLIRFIADSGTRRIVITDLTDPLIERTENQPFDIAEHYDDYRLKVNRYVNEHQNDGAIRKLRHNEPLDGHDYSELERILVHELGSQTDYETTYGPLPFGLLVRRVAKLDHAAAMEAFAEFVNAHTLNQTQIGFLHTVIDYIEHNGYLDPEQLAKPPFDRPRPMLKLFDAKQAMDLILCIRKVRDNAMPPEQTHIGALAG
ncbi:DEAD/DEAH box helicase family protein [Bifidobacterium biavatii]|uniref:Type I site-specific restriction-modification system n=1 Tax=Bifidobacterium biavatii DSM 23969 TaxID=1437608 RepID=A0A086ZEI1_9BIFI|nr:DEAD/DEAH box helicase family protein [Bifidobacterium biavatii]KFI44931.1 Type I site-specific restriction-modification system [Bifidobacterium biavatii DSM 23969]